MDMDISMDIHAKSVDMDMDMDKDGKFHIHGNPENKTKFTQFRHHLFHGRSRTVYSHYCVWSGITYR